MDHTVLVDTSVLVQFLRGEENRKVSLFETIIKDEIPFGISTYTYAEVLQGARDDAEHEQLDEYLRSQIMFSPKPGRETFREAATIFYKLKKQGFTLRCLVDVLIALTAIHNNLHLLHNDKDFELMKTAESRLSTLLEILWAYWVTAND